jgi:hypothetical protein
MESTSIPAGADGDPAVMATLQAMADRRGLDIGPEALEAAAVLDAWLAPHSYLDLVEPAVVFQWIERGGRSV